MMEDFLARLARRPVIAAVRSAEDLQAALKSLAPAVFLLGGSLMTLPTMVEQVHRVGKYAFVHLDLSDGLGRDNAAVDWCSLALRPDGLISTRPQLLRYAKGQGLMTIQRLFLVDSESLENGMRLIKTAPPDLVEVLPGLVPKAITRLKETLHMPVIAGGMVTEEEDLRRAMAAGASGVSTSERLLWDMDWK